MSPGRQRAIASIFRATPQIRARNRATPQIRARNRIRALLQRSASAYRAGHPCGFCGGCTAPCTNHVLHSVLRTTAKHVWLCHQSMSIRSHLVLERSQ